MLLGVPSGRSEDGKRHSPAGLYVGTAYSNNPNPDGSTALPSDLETDPTFRSDAISGVAIYVPISTLLPDPLPPRLAGKNWGQLFGPDRPAFDVWNWGYLDRAIEIALRHHKRYSLGVVVGYQNAGAQIPPQAASSYLQAAFPNAPRPFRVPSFEQSLPSWFEPVCNPANTVSYYPLPLAAGGTPGPGSTKSPWTRDSCAPTIDVWYPTQVCLSFKVPIPWNPNVQLFWASLARAMAEHLRTTCFLDGKMGACQAGDARSVYRELTLIHLPGLSEFDEELVFMNPKRGPPPTPNQSCPDGRRAQNYASNGNDWATNAIAHDNSEHFLHDLGYRETPASGSAAASTSVIEGIRTIASAWVRAFPDRVFALSALNNLNGIDLPDLAGRFGTGGVFRRIAWDLYGLLRRAGGAQLLLQSDDLADRFWDPRGPAARFKTCSTPLCVDQSIPWVNPQHFFPNMEGAIYGWQTDVGGVVHLPSGTWAPVAQCMLASSSEHCLDSTEESLLDSSFYGLLKYGWQPVKVKGVRVQYLEVMPGDVILRPRSIRKAVLENGWFRGERE